MAWLENHLEQISLSTAAIAELPFPPPKRFTNALLRSHDITSLIRDTEAHERTLFKYAPPEQANLQSDQRMLRKSIAYSPRDYNTHSLNGKGHPRTRFQPPAVAKLLANDTRDEARHKDVGASKERGEIDVNYLLKSAERLSDVYPIPGSKERIRSLQSRFDQLTASIGRYENRMSKQTLELSKINRRGGLGEEGYAASPNEISDIFPRNGKSDELPITAEDLEKEEQDVRELERKKQALEERVSGMERDLGGLLR